MRCPHSPNFLAPKSFGWWVKMLEYQTRMWAMSGFRPKNALNGVMPPELVLIIQLIA